MKKILSLAVAILMLFSLAPCGGNEDYGEGISSDILEVEEAVGVGTEIFKGITSLDFDGNEVDDSIFKEKELTMVNVWGTFCGPCISEMPELQKISEDYKDRVSLIGIVCDANENVKTEEAKEILEYCSVKYRNVFYSESLGKARIDEAYSVPLTIFLDEKGCVIGEVVGSNNYETWKSLIEELLG